MNIKNLKSKFLLLLIGLLSIDLLFTQVFVASRFSLESTPPNLMIVLVLLLLFFWNNGVIISKTNIFLVKKENLKSKKNLNRVRHLFYTWYFILFLSFIFFNFVPYKDPLFMHKYKIYFQFLGFIFLIYVIYSLIKNFKNRKV